MIAMLEAPPRHVMPTGVTIALCALEDNRDQPEAEAEGWLSEPERARADRLRGPGLRAAFVRGRGFLRRALGAALGLSPSAVPLAEAAGGKPVLAGRAGPEFNLSHSAGVMVLALSEASPVGIDLEFTTRNLDPLSLAPAVLTEAEAAALARLPGPDRRGVFLNFWTAREAFLKLTGEGLRRDPRTVGLRLSDGLPCAYDTPGVVLIRPDLRLPGAVCTLALGQPEATCRE
jgi:4'-phosphopantetheinyl transferase